VWPPDRFEEALGPFFEAYDELVFDHRARLADKTQLRKVGDRLWEVTQVLVDPEDDNLWCIDGYVDLRDPEALEGPLVALTRIGA
jgi:hypothetical protein